MKSLIQTPRYPLTWVLATIVLFLSVNNASAWIGTHRVNETSTDGITVQGDPITVTWSIVPDGTFIFSGSGGTFYSDFIAVMDEQFAVPVEDRNPDDLTQRSWFALLEQSFEFFTLKTGITYVYVHENDDEADADTGTPMEPHALGVPGKRGDARIGGSGVTGYAALSFEGPSTVSDFHGNTVFRTTRSWTSVSLKGICSHESMHSVGFHHSLVAGGPTLSNFSVKGPQVDDLLGLHYKYGDVYEKSGGNDTVANATDLGILAIGSAIGVGLDIPEGDTYSTIEIPQVDLVSIDSNTDTDVFKLRLDQATSVMLKVSPRGADYMWDVDNRARYTINSKVHSDLSFRILDASSSELYDIDSAAIGLDESTQVSLASGDYYVEITGSSTLGFGFNEIPTQFYALEITDLTTLADDLTLTVSQMGYVNVTLSGSGGESLSYTVASDPTNGTLTGTAPDLIYTPNTDYIGADHFTYYVSSGGSDSAIATVTLEVIETTEFIAIPASAGATGYHATINEATAFRSTGIAKTYDLDEDNVYGTAGYYFYGNGVDKTSDADGAPSWVTAVGSSGVTLSAQAGYVDFDNPTEPISDAVADWDVTTIGLVNTGTAGSWAELMTFTVDATAPRSFRLGVMAGNEPNTDGRWDPAALRLSFEGGSATEVIGLDPIELGMVFFDVTLADDASGTFSIEGETRTTKGSSIAGITFDLPPNVIPVANSASITVDEDGSVAITLTGSDPDDDSLNYAVVTAPTNGTLTGAAPGLTYTPNADFNGADSFIFTVNDGMVESVASKVSITVDAVNDAPVADAQSVSVIENDSLTITLSGSDVDGDSLTYGVVTAPANGSLSGTAPDLIYTPTNGHLGPDSFTFKGNDGFDDSAPATVSITVKEEPVAIMTYEFNNTGTANVFESDDPVPFQATTTTENVTATTFGGGSGALNPLALAADGIHISEGNGLADGTDDDMVGAIAADQYFTFTVTAAEGCTLDLQNLTFDINHGANGAQDYALRSSVDHFAADIVYTSGGITATATGHDIDLSAAVFDALTNVTFRIYFDDRVGNSSAGAAVVMDNVILRGNVNGGKTSSLDDWFATHQGLSDTSFDGDPDHDGIATGLEYVLNGDPTQSGDVILPELDAAGENFVFSFTRLTSSASDTTQVFQYSSTLQADDWTDLSITDPQAIEVSVGTEVDGLQTVTVTISKTVATNDKLFGRLKVSLEE